MGKTLFTIFVAGPAVFLLLAWGKYDRWRDERESDAVHQVFKAGQFDSIAIKQPGKQKVFTGPDVVSQAEKWLEEEGFVPHDIPNERGIYTGSGSLASMESPDLHMMGVEYVVVVAHFKANGDSYIWDGYQIRKLNE